MDIVLINAMSISIGIGSDFGMNNGGSGLPIVTMNFPTSFAQELVENLFRPYAQPDHFLFGISDQRGKTVEVALYFLADLIQPVSFPLVATIYGAMPAGPALYLIGADADIREEGIESFLAHQTSLGKYYIVCGDETGAAGLITPIVSDWRVELEKIYSLSEIRRIIWEKVHQSK